MSDGLLVVLDLAGTTVKDSGEVPAAFAGALHEYGITVTSDQLSAVRGSSKRSAIQDFVPAGPDRAARADQIYSSFKRHLEEQYARTGVQPIDGAEDAVTTLRTRGIRIALNTGFDRDITSMLLRELRWAKNFADAVICGDDVPLGRPAPYLIYRAMEVTRTINVVDVVNVGDTVLDLQAGRNARVGCNVAVLTGAHSEEALSRIPSTQIIASVAQLPQIVMLRYAIARNRRKA